MNKKIFILLFCLIMLISVSAVSAADLDDNNETVVASDMEVEKLSASNDVNAMDELNEDDTGSDDVLQSDAKSAAACEKEILSVEDSDSDVLGAKGSKITIDDAYYQKIGSDYKIIVTGYVMDADDEDINKGTVSIYLNDESKGYCDAEFGEFSGEVDVGPGSYNVRVRYHDDSGDYLDSQNEYYDNPIIIKPPEPTTWYVNGSQPYGGGGKSEADAFSTLNEALYAASNNDTVKIAAGTYTGGANIGPYIQKILTFEKYGDGEAIFDGEGQRIWSVGVDTINIYGLTFINGGGNYGGALYFLRDVSNSVINATFRDNSVSICGGAIYVDNSVSNLTLRSTFINNTANDCGAAVYIKSTASNLILNSTFIGNTAGNNGAGVYIGGNADNVKVYGEYRNNAASQGGVIYANNAFSSSVIDATFINNTAKNLGGAFCFNGDLTGVDISGKFLNNPGRDSIIYVANSVSGNSIHDSVFLNNEAYKICTVYNGEITAKDNWFGSNASNYYKIPEDVGIDLENWLFLNATADPSELEADEKSTIIFKLSSFDGSGISDYDASKMNVVLELSQTLGQLNKNTTLIGQEVIYTAKQEGNASVTGKVGTAYYTINLKNSEYRPAAVLNLYMISPGEYNPSFTVDIGGTVRNIMTGDKIKKGSVKLYLNGENVENVTVDVDDGSISASLGVLNAGNYTVKAVYHDDTGEFKDCEWNSSLEIKQAPTEIKLVSDTGEMSVGAIAHVAAELSPSEAGNLSYASNDTSVVDVSSTGVIVANGAGTALITVSFAGDDKYAEAENKTITLTVNLNPASVSVNNSTLNLSVDDTFTIVPTTTPAGLNVTYVVDNSGVVSVAADGVVTALKEGTGNITVKVTGNEGYAENSTTVVVTVSKIPTEIIVQNDTIDMKVTDEVNPVVSIMPSGAGELDFISSDVSVVTVNGIGTITAVGDGVANVTVRFIGNDKYAAAESKNITVTVSIVKMETSITENITAGDEGVAIHVVLPEDAAGRLMVEIDGESINPMGYVLINGTADINIPPDFITLGRHSYLVSYSGGNYADTFAYDSFDVAGQTPLIMVDCPVSAFAGDDVNVTVCIEDATGTVELYFDDNLIDAGDLDENSTISFVAEDLPAGSHYFTVEYSGDGKFYYDYMNFAIYVDKKAAEVNIITPVGYNVGDDVNVTVSIPGASGNVTVYVDSVENVVALQDGIALVPIYDLAIGEYSIVAIYDGDDTYGPAVNASSLFLEMGSSQFVNITIYDDLRITGVLMDQFGDPIANAPITCSIGGANSTVTTLADGSFTVQVVDDEVVDISYAGNEGILPSTFSVTLKGISPVIVRTESRFNITGNSITIKGYAIDKNAGEKGMTYATELLDINGNPIANAYIEFAINDKIHNRTTYENGSFEPYELNMLRAGRYTLAFSFGGNDQYNSTFAVVCVDLDKKPITIKASAKTYKASAKTKKYTVTLSTIVGSSADGKAHLRTGLKVTMQINGKTYTGKTNSKGQVSFDIKITKKGKYTAKISYAGDQTYNSASKSVKITIK